MRTAAVALAAMLMMGAAAASAEDKKPAPPDAAADRAERTDALLDRLALTDDPAQAAAVVALIVKSWSESGSPTVDLLLEYGGTAVADENYDKARKLLDSAIDLDPNVAELWAERGGLNRRLGRDDAAMNDLARALQLEPRHYPAMIERGRIQESRGQKAAALESYRRALAVFPAMPGLKEKIKEMALEVEGQRI